MINITLPDGSIKEYKKGIKPIEIASSISEGLAKKTKEAVFNGHYVESNRELVEDGILGLLTERDPEIITGSLFYFYFTHFATAKYSLL